MQTKPSPLNASDPAAPTPSPTVKPALAFLDPQPIATRPATADEIAQQLWECNDRIYACVNAIPRESQAPALIALRTAVIKAWQTATEAAVRAGKLAASERKAAN